MTTWPEHWHLNKVMVPAKDRSQWSSVWHDLFHSATALYRDQNIAWAQRKDQKKLSNFHGFWCDLIKENLKLTIIYIYLCGICFKRATETLTNGWFWWYELCKRFFFNELLCILRERFQRLSSSLNIKYELIKCFKVKNEINLIILSFTLF